MSYSILLESLKHRLFTLEHEELISAAPLRTGLEYQSDPQLAEAFRVLTASCNAEARISLIGDTAARQNMLELLETWPKRIDCWRRTPWDTGVGD